MRLGVASVQVAFPEMFGNSLYLCDQPAADFSHLLPTPLPNERSGLEKSTETPREVAPLTGGPKLLRTTQGFSARP